MNPSILITGASGVLGKSIVAAARNADFAVRQGVREALDHSEAAWIIGEAARRPVAYHSLTKEQMLGGARAQGMPEPAIAYLAGLYSVVRQGLAAGVTGDVEAIIGRKPIRFAEFARATAGAWRTPVPTMVG